MDPPTPSDPARSIKLILPAQHRYLALARDAALEACRTMRFSQFDGYKVEMAVDEACTSIIDHSYGGEVAPENALDHPGLTLMLTSHPDRLVIEITDRGAGLDFDSPPADGPPAGSAGEDDEKLGIYLIQRFVDAVEYRRDGDQGNCLRLTKNG